MNLLSIIDRIYENSHFGIILSVSILVLFVLFIIVLILGIKDSKKEKKVKKTEIEEEVKDITFDLPPELETIKEDVTFEMPALTQNLENFKKNLEEEIQKEEMAEVRKTSGLILPKEKKTIKILDLEKIEDTRITPIKENRDSKEESSVLPAKTQNNRATESKKPEFSYSTHNPKILEEKLFTKNKTNTEIPIIKEGLKPTREPIEIGRIKEIKSPLENKNSKNNQTIQGNKGEQNNNSSKNNLNSNSSLHTNANNKNNSSTSNQIKQPAIPLNSTSNNMTMPVTNSPKNISLNQDQPNKQSIQTNVQKKQSNSNFNIQVESKNVSDEIKKVNSTVETGTYSNDDDF